MHSDQIPSKDALPRVLYIVYWGASEPLGQSLVLPAVKRLAEMGTDLTLVTFEKPADLSNKDKLSAIRQDLSRTGIRWLPLRYHKRPKIPATAYDIIQGGMRSVLNGLRGQPHIIHARTYIGGLIGAWLAPLIKAKLVYHNEGFYPDEQVDGGVWAYGSRPHRVAGYLERKMYARADGIISLSLRAKSVIEEMPQVKKKKTPVIVVPSCVDLERFRFRSKHHVDNEGRISLVYSGSVGGRYILDKVGRFVKVAAQEARVRLKVLTKAEPDLVSSMLDAGGLSREAWSMESAPYAEMPGRLTDHQAGLFFLTQGISEHGCSPTKIGEYWAVGLPVVTTANVSDTDEIIRRHRVGVIIKEHSDEAYRQAFRELGSLLDDPALAGRCRRAAEEYYALEPACERQLELYQSLVPNAEQRSERRLASING